MTTILEGMSKLNDWPVDESTGKPAYCVAQDVYACDKDQHTVYAYTDEKPLACEISDSDDTVVWHGTVISDSCAIGDFERFEDCDQNFVTHDQWLMAKSEFPPPSDSDWAKAPADATHWFPNDKDWFARWGKLENGKWYTTKYEGPGGRPDSDNEFYRSDQEDHDDLINRGMFKLRPEGTISSTSTEENNVDAWL